MGISFMIIYFLLNFVVAMVTFIFDWLPKVTELPFGLDAILVTTFGYWYGFLAVMWPLEVVWVCVLWYYGIKIGMIFVRMIPFVGRAVV